MKIVHNTIVFVCLGTLVVNAYACTCACICHRKMTTYSRYIEGKAR